MGAENDLDVTISAIGARGDGIAEADGRRLFVPFTAPGDRVRVRPGRSRGDDGVAAELVALIAPGPGRTAPVCPHYGACGGCALQHLETHAYLDWKRAQVGLALARAGLAEVPVAPTVATPPATRRRATFAAVRAGGSVRLGFNERQSNRVVDLAACPVLDPRIVALLPALRALLARLLPARGALDVTVTALDGGLDVLLTGGAEPDLAAREALAAFAGTADIARLSWRRGEGRDSEPIAHRRAAAARFGEVMVAIPPGGFLQASPAGQAALTAAVLEGVGAARSVADLFAGSGTFTFPLARRAVVHAVEGEGGALERLKAAARGLSGVTAERRDLFREPLTARELGRFEAVVFDPPRAGAKEQAGELARSGVPVVVGVSCNPASFARDARILADGGYRLGSVTPVDQFLWSPHVELVGVFRR